MWIDFWLPTWPRLLDFVFGDGLVDTTLTTNMATGVQAPGCPKMFVSSTNAFTFQIPVQEFRARDGLVADSQAPFDS